MQIKMTNDLDIFKLLPHNRAICVSLVTKLRASIQYKNMLHVKPIIVNKNMEVIDGQHRLTAAKSLGLPIYYQIQEDEKSSTTIEDIVCLQISQSWNIKDYLHAYVEVGKKPYIKLKNFMENNNIDIAQALLLLCKKRDHYANFKLGKLEIGDIDEAQERYNKIKIVIEYINEKQVDNSYKKWVYTKSFHKAMSLMLDNPDFEFDKFMKALPYKLQVLRPCATYREYYQMLAAIYNHKRTKQIPTDTGDAIAIRNESFE